MNEKLKSDVRALRPSTWSEERRTLRVQWSFVNLELVNQNILVNWEPTARTEL